EIIEAQAVRAFLSALATRADGTPVALLAALPALPHRAWNARQPIAPRNALRPLRTALPGFPLLTLRTGLATLSGRPLRPYSAILSGLAAVALLALRPRHRLALL